MCVYMYKQIWVKYTPLFAYVRLSKFFRPYTNQLRRTRKSHPRLNLRHRNISILYTFMWPPFSYANLITSAFFRSVGHKTLWNYYVQRRFKVSIVDDINITLRPVIMSHCWVKTYLFDINSRNNVTKDVIKRVHVIPPSWSASSALAVLRYRPSDCACDVHVQPRPISVWHIYYYSYHIF